MTEHKRLLGDGLLMGGFQFMYVCFKAVRNLMSRWAVSCFCLLGILWGNGRSSPVCSERCRHIPARVGANGAGALHLLSVKGQGKLQGAEQRIIQSSLKPRVYPLLSCWNTFPFSSMVFHLHPASAARLVSPPQPLWYSALEVLPRQTWGHSAAKWQGTWRAVPRHQSPP